MAEEVMRQYTPEEVKSAITNASCPRCDDLDSNYDQLEGPDSELVWQPATCGSCGHAWNEVYHLAGIEAANSDPATWTDICVVNRALAILRELVAGWESNLTPVVRHASELLAEVDEE